jgi:hypothetical protein
MQQIRRLANVSRIIQVIDEARGAGYFRKLVRHPKLKRGKQSLHNYKSGNRLPPDTYLVVTAELAALSCSASPSLWGITEPSKARAA